MNFGKKKISLHHWNVIFFSSIFLLQVKIFKFNCIVGHIFSFTNYSWLEISNLMMN